MNFKIGDKVRIKCIDGSNDLEGEVKDYMFGRVLVLLDEYRSIAYEFDESVLELINKVDNNER